MKIEWHFLCKASMDYGNPLILVSIIIIMNRLVLRILWIQLICNFFLPSQILKREFWWMEGSNGQDFSLLLSLITEFMEGKVLPKADFSFTRFGQNQSSSKRCSKRGAPCIVQWMLFFHIVANFGVERSFWHQNASFILKEKSNGKIILLA